MAGSARHPAAARVEDLSDEIARVVGGQDDGAVGHVLQGSRSVYFADDTDVNPEIAELRTFAIINWTIALDCVSVTA